MGAGPKLPCPRAVLGFHMGPPTHGHGHRAPPPMLPLPPPAGHCKRTASRRAIRPQSMPGFSLDNNNNTAAHSPRCDATAQPPWLLSHHLHQRASCITHRLAASMYKYPATPPPHPASVPRPATSDRPSSNRRTSYNAFFFVAAVGCRPFSFRPCAGPPPRSHTQLDSSPHLCCLSSLVYCTSLTFLLPRALTPHIVLFCSFGIMHDAARASVCTSQGPERHQFITLSLVSPFPLPRAQYARCVVAHGRTL
ncbi:hypothetical protein IWZ00DRAFT_164039 [Phyllosticta capitalensis]